MVRQAGTDLAAYNGVLATAAREQRAISPASEWLLDNYYLIEDQVRTVQEDLPGDYGVELPRLTSGAFLDHPRVFEAVVALTSHTDARFDEDYLLRFIDGIQDVSPLSIGEVWAIPIMLRIVLVENLRRLAARVVQAQEDEYAADDWANRLLEQSALEDEAALLRLLEGLDAERPAVDAVFMVRLAQRVQGEIAGLETVNEWIGERLAASGIVLEALALELQQEQAANQVSIANAITSIRFLEAFDWKTFFERTSLVEQILREDPADVYGRMGFRSRDRYRHALESMAKRCPLSEIELAEALISTSLDAMSRDATDGLKGHVGYHLISAGRYPFEKAVRYQRHLREAWYRGPLRHRGPLYWGSLGALTLFAELALALFARALGVEVWAVVALMAAGAVPLSELAMSTVTRVAASIWPPRPLPKLDHGKPVAAANKTLVVVPALMSSVEATQSVFDNMEVAFLANVDRNVHFALLGDLKGSSTEHAEGDQELISAATLAVRELNERYAAEYGFAPFHLFVRGRSFSRTENRWMGWERKRGALAELSRVIRGSADTTFTHQLGDTEFVRDAAFILTLDADTVLPRDGARKLISTIAHPLNRAQYNPRQRRVGRGYGLIQPRVGMSLPAANRSSYARLHSGVTGMDPYAGAVSDTYQDVFGEGSFTGKGIYEIDVYNAVLQERFPEGLLLSHDLLEGCLLRTGLVSDIEVLDAYPSSYLSQSARLHRWVRGDWQTASWLLPRTPSASGVETNPLTLLHRWKVADNLRRSLFAPSLMVLVALGWAVVPGAAPLWTLVLPLIVLFPALIELASALLVRPKGVGLGVSFASARDDFTRGLNRGWLTLVTLPHQAWLMGDAILRATYRARISRRLTLEWETAADVEATLKGTLVAFVRAMWPSSILGVMLLLPGAVPSIPRAALTVPLALAWAGAPFLAWLVSRPISAARPPMTEAHRLHVRRIARKTWRFFETFVTAEGHWLAPDNYQEDPKDEVAHRTSPTNMGLQLLTYLSAADLGYVSLSGLVDRVSLTLTTMVGMERFRGHFYNWYDTLTLQPLRPGYVSTVDSGNLAGHLVALRVGLLEYSERPLIGDQVLDGVEDTARMALADLNADRDRLGEFPGFSELRTALDGLLRRASLEEPPRGLGGWSALLRGLAESTEPLLSALVELSAAPGANPGAADRVTRAITDTVSRVREPLDDIQTFARWARYVEEIPVSLRSTETAAALGPILDHVPSLVGLAEGLEGTLRTLDSIAQSPLGDTPEEQRAAAEWAQRVAEGIRSGRSDCETLLARLRLQADIAREMWEHTDFRVLFDRSRLLFSIGFNTAEGRLDGSFYDMLASECRLASFVAIAKGDVPQEHWFRLGRLLTATEGGRALISWSASMFEYLMPLLVMKSWPDTVLDLTYQSVVRRQIQYGRQRGVPWGVSESAFNAKDVDLTYQYQAFGVPGLGLKRGLSEDVVVAPYAAVLALPVDPGAVLANLDALSERRAEGRFGYYEAIDYTPGRVPAGSERAIVRAYFAHHQGMSFIALANAVTEDPMQHRFHSDPVIRSAELLLQERVPRHVELAHPHVEEVLFVRSVRELPPPMTRAYPLANTPTPATHFLSNGHYSVMVTNAGGGYSRWGDVAISRYREDITRDCWGSFIYVRHLETGDVWSAAHQPTGKPADDYHVTFSADRAEFRRSDGNLDTHTEVLVSPEDDVEIRRVTVTNHGREAATIELTTYFEVALASQAADQTHKVFSNLFVGTEVLPELRALLFTRRPRSADEPTHWGLHVLACETTEACEWSYETDREAFLGRLGEIARPAALQTPARPLTGRVGAVLDPICSLRLTVRVPASETVRAVFCTGVAEERESAVKLAEKYSDIRAAQRAADLAWTAAQIELRDLGISAEEAVTYQRLASRLLLTDPHSPLKVKTPVENGLPLSGLWPLGISGDLPILLVRIERLEDTPLVRQALLAHQYWRHSGLVADLVILNTKPTGYADELDQRLHLLVRTGHALQLMDKPGGVFIRRADQMHPDAMNLLLTVARATLEGDAGPIALQLNQRGERPELPDRLVPTLEPQDWQQPPFERPKLEGDNGHGGFDPETGEYVIVLEGDGVTPAPWINVMARPQFGTMVSEAGIGCTWAKNSHENRITTWNNDPVTDGSGETLYIRDEETGEVWSPTPMPARDGQPYVIRHGQGYSVFEHTSHSVRQEVVWFVSAEDPVRVARVRLTNLSDRRRRLSITHHVEWVLGSSRSRAQQLVVTWYDPEARMLTAHNHYNEDFPGRPAFLACDCEVESYTCSRTEFVGRNGAPSFPAAMKRKALGGQSGRFHDNCGAVQVKIDIGPGESAEASFLLGQTENLAEARRLVARYRQPGTIEAALAEVRQSWADILGTIQVSTPDPALDELVNRRLLYQVLSCRIWGRTATYQSSGAFGFRDQLQDVMAMLLVRPDLVREQIVEAASRQFEQGDVMHWWQPYSGRGVRTKISDDRHWLPLVVAEYLRTTGDASVLDEITAYVAAPQLDEEHEDLYLQPSPSERSDDVYGHCVTALESGRPTGAHGLPLIGGGDWNDGMNRVGHKGSGESVWLAWFLDVVLRRFADVCDLRGERDRGDGYRAWATDLVATVEREAWDGSWYRRAFFDDGTPLGSKQSDECKIDAIAQAWAVISGGGDPARALRALESVEENLVRWDDGLVKLLAPPFDKTPNDPGYIKGYVPGVRENGGQYTHAAVWVALAYLLKGDGDEALALLDLINPINHAATPEGARRYRVEPYVLAADVYAVPPHVGRGGWTWYTGSASWYYRVAVNHLLGLQVVAEGEHRFLIIDPCVPKTWSEYAITYRSGSTRWDITVSNPRGVNRGVERVELDGGTLAHPRVPLTEDGREHEVRVTLLGG